MWKTVSIYKKFLKLKDLSPNTNYFVRNYVTYKFTNLKVVPYIKSFEHDLNGVTKIHPNVQGNETFYSFDFASNIRYEAIVLDDNTFRIEIVSDTIIPSTVKFDVLIFDGGE